MQEAFEYDVVNVFIKEQRPGQYYIQGLREADPKALFTAVMDTEPRNP